ncbi:hypothetical protein V7S43_004743 [Phytophthora oleae]|uniref:CCZ1/INTU/HSP4 first Longin domain-containing protein n=1 Tax=Phytophthora oleae TaxID=2107226 RepID=A0ABD3FW27_9STRA
MEVLLLDTTEKEGEDNLLYHYVHSERGVGSFSTGSLSSKSTHWLDLRGVLAAAVGATTSLCGESLRFARFGDGYTNGSTGIVGFVNIYEVLYALAIASDIPEAIIQYYTRSSCDLLLSFFGYPDAKLSQWRRQNGCSISSSALTAKLDAFFKGIFSVIHKDLSFGSSLHFAFDGHVPAVNYPLETMAKLAVLDMPFDSSPDQQYTVIGRCIFYRKQLVFSTMRSDYLRLLSQWLLVDQFVPDSTSSGEGSAHFNTFELHDFRFTRHGKYPKRHALLIITHDNVQLQLAFLVERKLENNAVEWAKHFTSNVNQRCVEDLERFCSQHLETYLKSLQELLHDRTEKLQARFATESSRFFWFSVALDRLRGIILGDDLHLNQSIMKRFVQYLVTYQGSRCLHEAVVEISPEHPSGIPPLKLNDDHALFLREKSTDADDISMGDARIFPEVNNSVKNKGRMHRQSAEQIVVDGQLLWIIATSYETLEFFSIIDAELPLELLDEEFNRLCEFGGGKLQSE